jgi:hypothetical protein
MAQVDVHWFGPVRIHFATIRENSHSSVEEPFTMSWMS